LPVASNFEGGGDKIDVSFATDQSHELLIVFEKLAVRHGEEFGKEELGSRHSQCAVRRNM